MKKLLFTVSILSSMLAFTSCSEDEAASVTPSTNTSSFVWVDNTGASITADSAFFVTQYKTIKAFKGGIAQFVEINLTSDTVGTYTVGSSNAISYLNGSSLYIAATGSVTISTNASSKMSGTFTSLGTGANLTSVSGTFTNISVR